MKNLARLTAFVIVRVVAAVMGGSVACGGALAPSEALPPLDEDATPAAGATTDDGGTAGTTTDSANEALADSADAAGDADASDLADSGSDPGAADGAGPFCDTSDTTQPFSPAVDVPGLEFPPGGPPRTDVRLTSDELRAVYARPTSGSAGSSRLCEATRTSRSVAFGGERDMYELGWGAGYGSFSPDGLIIYFNGGSKYPPVDGGIPRSTFTAQRASASLPFDVRTPITALPGGNADIKPYLVGTDLWFSRLGLANFDIFHVSLLPAGGAPVPENELNVVNKHDVNPVVSADGLTVFFARGDLEPPRVDGLPPGSFVLSPRIMEAHRATLQTPFTIREVCELNTTGNETPSWLSPDGCRLYFTSNYRVRVASRCAP